MDELDYNQLFGVGENETEPAAPSEGAETTGTGEKAQEAAAPVGTKRPGTAEAGGEALATAEPAGQGENTSAAPAPEHKRREDTGKEPRKAGEAQEQTIQERARFAAARRKAEAERDEAVRLAREEGERALNEVFQKNRVQNPYTGERITNKAEYDAYRRRYEAEQKAGLLAKSGMSEQQFQQFVENLPEVRAAQEEKAAAKRAQAEALEERAQMKIDGQLKEIAALDPGITALADLAKMDNYPRFYELVQKGNTLTDAYKLVNMDRLTQNTAAAARQAALNAAAGKAHLGKTETRGVGAKTVPADIRAEYQAFNPGASDAEIQRHYNQYLRK